MVTDVALLDSIIQKRGIVDLSQGARKFARHLARDKGNAIRNAFVYGSVMFSFDNVRHYHHVS